MSAHAEAINAFIKTKEVKPKIPKGSTCKLKSSCLHPSPQAQETYSCSHCQRSQALLAKDQGRGSNKVLAASVTLTPASIFFCSLQIQYWALSVSALDMSGFYSYSHIAFQLVQGYPPWVIWVWLRVVLLFIKFTWIWRSLTPLLKIRSKFLPSFTIGLREFPRWERWL